MENPTQSQLEKSSTEIISRTYERAVASAECLPDFNDLYFFDDSGALRVIRYQDTIMPTKYNSLDLRYLDAQDIGKLLAWLEIALRNWQMLNPENKQAQEMRREYDALVAERDSRSKA
jgi:hypothetical protein